MKTHVALILFLCAFPCAGCKKPPTPTTPTATLTDKGEADPFRAANEAFRYPDNAASADDWTRFRDGLQQVTSHITKSDVRIGAKVRKFLDSDAHLSAAEFAEIETAAFRAADAHYLDECYLLRDVVRSLEVGPTARMEQADYLFDWAMRNVFLHEQVEDWVPPAFTLRGGCGSAPARALVFLALLRQARMDGCLIVMPDTEPTQLLVGVLEPNTANLRLYDPRLGLPVLSKDGKSVATLRDALVDPSVLKPAGITPAQAKKLEARLVCPLFALAPRMEKLQEIMKKYDPITLHLNAPALFEQIAQASPLPVKVWNPPANGMKMANSPTRCLWMFLPKQEGGLDATQRAAKWAQARLPFTEVIVNLASINVTEKLMPRRAWLRLLSLAFDLCNKYEVQTIDMHLRGLREPMVRRLERMRPFVDNPSLAGLDKDGAFVSKEVPTWLDDLRNAYAAVDALDPQEQAKGKHAVNVIWGQDLFLYRLIDVDKAEKFDREEKNLVLNAKTSLTKVLAVGIRDYFSHELPRLQALANQEKAERAQALLDATTTPSEDAKTRAADAWMEARSSWSIYTGRISLQQKVDQYSRQISLVERMQFPGFQFYLNARLGLTEGLALDFQKYFNAKLRLAECLAHADRAGAAAAAKYREETKREIETVERKAFLSSVLAELGQQARQAPETERAAVQARLDLLANDWAENGNYDWMKRQIDRLQGPNP